MPDITMCSGQGCPIKEKCYRNYANASDHQSYFSGIPYDFEKKECAFYWGDNAQSIFIQLNDIFKDEI